MIILYISICLPIVFVRGQPSRFFLYPHILPILKSSAVCVVVCMHIFSYFELVIRKLDYKSFLFS